MIARELLNGERLEMQSKKFHQALLFNGVGEIKSIQKLCLIPQKIVYNSHNKCSGI